MKKTCLIILAFIFSTSLKAWWDPGHMLTALIAYENLNPTAKQKVDELIKILERDYPYANNFVSAATWPDNIKAEGVRNYNTWHYTNIPYNPYGVAVRTQPEVDVIWAIDKAKAALAGEKVNNVDKARQLAFLIHFVGDIHQPLHSTSYYNNDLPAGNLGGNAFYLSKTGKWKNLHAAWDDGCGFTSELNDINPYGKERAPLSEENLDRLKEYSAKIRAAYPEETTHEAVILDQDFWALESHKLAIKYGYKGVQKETKDKNGKVTYRYLRPNDPLSEDYQANGMKIVEKRLALGGYRLAKVLNELFPEK